MSQLEAQWKKSIALESQDKDLDVNLGPDSESAGLGELVLLGKFLTATSWLHSANSDLMMIFAVAQNSQ